MKKLVKVAMVIVCIGMVIGIAFSGITIGINENFTLVATNVFHVFVGLVAGIIIGKIVRS